MDATTRSTKCTPNGAALYVAFELGSTKWVLASTIGAGQRPRLCAVVAGDLPGLWKEVLTAKARFGVPLDAPVRSCYEAGREGFWLHRWLCGEGIANIVVDASSIEVNRRQRHTKTDRLDAQRLLQSLLRWDAGERKVWSVVRVPSPEEEAQRQLQREVATVQEDRKRVRNRLQGLLVTQGIRGSLRANFLERLPEFRTGDGRPLPEAWRARLEREWAHLTAIEARLTALQAVRATQIAEGTDRVATVARRLCELRGIAATGAQVFSAELFGTRTFNNGREIGALTGLVPDPYRSDQRVRDQGISKAGRGELRRVAIQLAWGWLRWQPDSDLSQWFRRRFDAAGGRSRRVGIVALARKLIIAMWRYVAQGVLPAGARLKTVS